MLSLLAVVVYGSALVAAAASDLSRYEIPNRQSIALAAGFAIAAYSLSGADLANHLAAAGATFLVTALLFARGLLGGGDVKLMSATALWVGLGGLTAFALLMALFGAALAAMLLAARRLLAPSAVDGRWYAHLLARDAGVPYGIAIAGAGLVLLPQLFAAPAARQAIAQVLAPAVGG
jgi:prepilin peptidase CpaA